MSMYVMFVPVAEECAAQRGVMAAGNCWIDGERQ